MGKGFCLTFSVTTFATRLECETFIQNIIFMFAIIVSFWNEIRKKEKNYSTNDHSVSSFYFSPYLFLNQPEYKKKRKKKPKRMEFMQVVGYYLEVLFKKRFLLFDNTQGVVKMYIQGQLSFST